MFKAAFTALALAASPAMGAGAGTPATVDILPGWRESDGRHMAGLSIRLAPGWKTYWRAPGDAGIPPRFNWSGSSNVADVEVRYPIPKVMNQNGFRSIGYPGNVVFPLVISTRDSAKPIEIRGEIELGVCHEVCIPVTLTVRAKIPAGGAHDAVIAAGLQNQPAKAGPMTCEIQPISDGLRLSAAAVLPEMGGAVAVIETGNEGVWVSQAVVHHRNGRLVAEVELVSPAAKPFALARSEVRMTVLTGEQAIELLGCR